MLGLDPLYIANEGKLVAIIPSGSAEKVLEAMRSHKYGRDAVVIGEVVPEHPGRVVMQTVLGTTRIVDMLTGEHLPRIC
jgi:hydrogenase expression/formation protein HypE